MTPTLESKWAEIVAEIAVQEKRLVPSFARVKVLLLEWGGMVTDQLKAEKKTDG